MQKYLLVLLLGCFVGCDDLKIVSLPAPPKEYPVVNLPLPLREYNWTSRNGEGSCVIAASVYHMRWQDQLQIASRLRTTYSGGQTATSIQNIWIREGIEYVCTENGDPSFLEWASESRRGAIIWYFPSHCVHFCGFTEFEGQEFALLNDNNRIDGFIRIPKREFIKNWRGFGGFACTALFSPAPPLPWSSWRVQK